MKTYVNRFILENKIQWRWFLLLNMQKKSISRLVNWFLIQFDFEFLKLLEGVLGFKMFLLIFFRYF
jgi:hypothetical protein